MDNSITLFASKHSMSAAEVESKWGKKSLVCKCGKLKTLSKTGRLASTCGDKRCHSRFGVTRPEHSKFMKANASSIAGCFQKGRVNTFLNSLAWKRQALINKNIDTYKKTDNEIETLFRTQVSLNAKSISAAKTIIINGYKKWKKAYDIEDIDITNLDKYSDAKIYMIRKMFQSIKSIEADTGTARRYKRTVLFDFKYNFEGQESVHTRSSYETSYIEFFEKNHIWWSYETLRIRTVGGYYVPDIVFHYKGKKYILEIKGFLLDQAKYFSSKILPCINYSKQNGYKMLFTYDPKITTMENLISQEVIID